MIVDFLAISFIGISVLSFVLFYIGTNKDKTILMFFSFWTVVVGTLSYVGFFKNTTLTPPRMLVVILPTVLYTIYFIRKMEIKKMRINYLLAIHILRLPVELTLYELFLKGEIPVVMTFKGWNFDVFIGVSALLLLLYKLISKKGINKTIFLLWNYVGLVFLMIIVMTAIFALPSPIQQLAFDQPNKAILEFPYTLLPGLVVPIVFLSHVFCLKIIRVEMGKF